MPAKFKGTPLEFLLSKAAIQPSGCWWFTGSLDHRGYGTFFPPRIPGQKKKALRAHRASYAIHRGPIPDGLDLDHICHDPRECRGGDTCPHRRCINPDHLEPVSGSGNHQRGRAHTATSVAATKAAYAAFTHCCNGHEYTEDNVIRRNGWRLCKACQHNAMAKGNANRKAKRQIAYAARDAAGVYGYIYFVVCHSTDGPDFVKIGFSKEPWARMIAIKKKQGRMISPVSARLDTLEPIGVIDGSRSLERSLHRMFSAFRNKGEWFVAEPLVLDAIQSVIRSKSISSVDK